MEQYDYIRTGHRVYGKSIRQLSEETGHSRNTIRKVLQNEHRVYTPRKQQTYPVLGPHLNVINQWLERDKSSPRKQRHTGRRIYRRLVEEFGYNGSENTVCRYVKQARLRIGLTESKVYIPSDPECAHEGEVDWGAAIAILGGVSTRIKYFCMRSKYSGKYFVRCYPCERQQAFFDGHIHAFQFFGGVFQRLIYDNLKSAVQKILRGKDRKENENFQKFHSYYNFEPRFCNPCKGNEKGGVEGLVGYARRNHFVPIPEEESLESLNEKLLEACMSFGSHRISGREKTVLELFEEEKSHLLSLPVVPFSNIRFTEGKVDHYSTIAVERNRYSVPVRYAGLKVRVTIGVDRLDFFSGAQQIAVHARLFNEYQWILNPDHYLDLIRMRPGSFDSARPIRQWRKQWPDSFNQLLERFRTSQGVNSGTKDFISVLLLHRNHRKEDIEAAVDLALENQINTSDGVKHILFHSNPAIKTERLPAWPATDQPNLAGYILLGERS